jgi:uncharacterized membrane protein
MYDRMNDLNDHHGGFGGDVWWHLLIMILVIALIGLAVWFILSRLHGATPRGGSPATEDSAIATLRDRLARSEISEEEYRSRLALLEGADTTS